MEEESETWGPRHHRLTQRPEYIRDRGVCQRRIDHAEPSARNRGNPRREGAVDEHEYVTLDLFCRAMKAAGTVTDKNAIMAALPEVAPPSAHWIPEILEGGQ